jgi:hypothetical protein
MALQAQYSATPKIGIGALSVANALRDGNGTIVTTFTAGTSGSRIDKIVIKATATTTAGTVRLFVHNGTNASLFSEVIINPVVVSATNPAFETVVDLLGGLILPTGYSLRASTEKAEAINVIALGGDF